MKFDKTLRENDKKLSSGRLNSSSALNEISSQNEVLQGSKRAQKVTVYLYAYLGLPRALFDRNFPSFILFFIIFFGISFT